MSIKKNRVNRIIINSIQKVTLILEIFSENKPDFQRKTDMRFLFKEKKKTGNYFSNILFYG